MLVSPLTGGQLLFGISRGTSLVDGTSGEVLATHQVEVDDRVLSPRGFYELNGGKLSYADLGTFNGAIEGHLPDPNAAEAHSLKIGGGMAYVEIKGTVQAFG